jgi:hypothetical protein
MVAAIIGSKMVRDAFTVLNGQDLEDGLPTIDAADDVVAVSFVRWR